MKRNQQRILINLRKARGLLDRLTSMTEEGEYCIDIMQQNLALIGLLKAAHQMLMENHLNSCFKRALESKDERKKREMITEILKVTSLYNR